MESHYAYLDTAPVDWPALKSHYTAQALAIDNEEEFIDFLQVIKQFFIDPHFNVGPLNSNDFSVTPTGTDIWVDKHGDNFVIRSLKANSAASQSALSVGDMILAIDGRDISAVIRTVFNDTSFPLRDQHKVWAVNVALGGYRNRPREITVIRNIDKILQVKLAPSYEAINALRNGPTLTVNTFKDVGYIRFNNSLGDSNTVNAFREAITSLLDTTGIVIDLRNTPSGGNTTVAEPILGHFVSKKTPYQIYRIQNAQQHYREGPLLTAYVKPETPHYNKPVVVLVGTWTGSMGEGMAIGFDAIGAKAIVGEPMADLLGGITQFSLPNTNISIELAFERLYHVDGSYREDFVPKKVPKSYYAGGEDAELAFALALLSKH